MSGRNRRSERDSGPDPLDVHALALGRAIKVLRTEQGMERGDLAEAADVSYPYLSEIENGKKRPSSRTLESLAEALGLRAHELLAAADSRVGAVAEDFDEDATFLLAEAPRRSRWFRDDTQLVASARVSRPRQMADQADDLQELLRRLSPEDVQRVLDLARRLAR